MTTIERGLYGKYVIKKADGSEIDPDAEYFVLRLDNDPHAVTAVLTWCNLTNNQKLYEDILKREWDRQDCRGKL